MENMVVFFDDRMTMMWWVGDGHSHCGRGGVDDDNTD